MAVLAANWLLAGCEPAAGDAVDVPAAAAAAAIAGCDCAGFCVMYATIAAAAEERKMLSGRARTKNNTIQA